MAMIFHSPTEPAIITKRLQREAGEVEVQSSGIPEDKGVDFLWRGNGQWWGIQRKELHDYLASLQDGRLTKEIAQMTDSLSLPIVVIEGRMKWAGENLILKNAWKMKAWTRQAMTGRELTLMSRGIHVMHTDDFIGTVKVITNAYRWSQHASHETATSRPKPYGHWGSIRNRDFQIHMLTSLPGIAKKTAETILDTIGFPLTIGVTVDELCEIPGIGKQTATKIVKVFQ